MTVTRTTGSPTPTQATRTLRAGEAPAGRDGVPTALKETAAKQKKEYTNPDGTERLVSYDGRQMPFGAADAARLPKGSFASALREMKASRDAGNAIVTADNATLHTLTFCYGTHKPMEAWLTKVPEDGKLKMNLIATPSTHVGSDNAAMMKNFDLYGKTNVYNVEIRYPDGTTERHRFDMMGNDPPQFGPSKPASTSQTASASPTFEIDLKKWAGKGDITISGYADQSSVGGYIEHRQTILHI